jgi:hypothetical protein
VLGNKVLDMINGDIDTQADASTQALVAKFKNA